MHRLARLHKNPPSSVIQPWKTHTICSGYWKTSLWGSKQKGHFTGALMIAGKKLSGTHSTILCHHWMFIKPSNLSQEQICRGYGTHRKQTLCVDGGQLKFAVMCWSAFNEGTPPNSCVFRRALDRINSTDVKAGDLFYFMNGRALLKDRWHHLTSGREHINQGR